MSQQKSKEEVEFTTDLQIQRLRRGVREGEGDAESPEPGNGQK